MKTRILLSGLLALALCSCAKEASSGSSLLRLYADAPESTRISINDGRSVWNKGDKVSVFTPSGENESWEYSGDDNARNGCLTRTGTSVPEGRKVALYPYNKGNSFSGDKLSASLKYEQSVPSGSPLLFATTETDRFSFKYATAFVRISITGTAMVKELVLSACGGEPLAGKVSVDLSGQTPTFGFSGTTKTLIMKNVSVSESLDCYFAVPCGVYGAGFSVSASLSSGEVVSSRNTLPRDLAPGQVVTLPIEVRDALVIPVVFADPNAKAEGHTPILADFPTATVMQKSGTINNPKNYSFGTPYNFTVYSQTGFCKDTQNSGAQIKWLNLGTKFIKEEVVYGGEGYSYIKFPRISGKRLAEISLEINSPVTNSILNVSSGLNSDMSGKADIVPSRPVTVDMIMKLEGTAANTAYYLCTGKQSNTRIVSLTLVYL